MNEGQPCVVCGHSVVAWDPEESTDRDDLVCYSCGVHKDSEAWRKVEELRAVVEALKTSNKGLHRANAELAKQLDAREEELDARSKALEDWRSAAYKTKAMLEETRRDCLNTLKTLRENPLYQRQAE